jgi:uncharacterized protein YdeI (YjbR/CyaY-like superfamily)
MPRKANGTWSLLNKKRVQKMIKLGRMTDAGLEKIEDAKRTGAWYKLDNINELRKAPPDLTKEL